MTRAAWALALGSSIVFAPIQTPAQTTSTPSPAAGCELASLRDRQITLRDSFAHTVQDLPTLRFLALIRDMTPEQQHEAFSLARRPVSYESASALEATVAQTCAGSEISYRATRAEVLLLWNWKHISTSDQNFLNIQDSLLLAVASLAERSLLPSDSVNAALARFGTSLAALVGSGPPAASGCLPDANATVIKTAPPRIPPAWIGTGTSWTIEVKTDLDSDGLVEAASLINRGSEDKGLASALEDSAVLAAVTSTYAPEIKNCKSIGGSYEYRADFNSSG